ncbi:nitrate reductase molybdenum cofactor assembly chaperone [Bacillus thermocopriae]|uniref:Nitrate reductase molybdenum cofactor assembly chaperone n=2 Tax=Neobacillus thermocopriae TaxID=1215031 RepID=A0A6B3TQZ1_9BACI|nr:nitrate reductase molybdenum cofactor assembly chaperone [Neobacillus thermocopriae]NEX79062.1 nitrate reductase molybdenum cofactor assembly chaperone [Neobacillus thermocopriae]
MVVPWTEEKQLIFKLCSIMLRYPDQAWVKSEEMLDMISSLEDQKVKKAFLAFWDYISKTSWEELTENYVRWFDLSESTTLYLTYGIFGDNRERGPAFVRLKLEFAKAGFYLKENELPDYLPLILEFASVAEPKYAQKVFAIHWKAITNLLEALKKEQNPYMNLVHICVMTMESVLPKTVQKMNHHAS